MRPKCLYSSPVGAQGKPLLEQIIRKFGSDCFDYLILVYDGTPFTEPVFQSCEIIRDKGPHPYLFKKYLTPERCRSYDYIFPWMDDIDIRDFDVFRFLEVMKQNSLELAQPALTPDSVIWHDITRRQEGKTGRVTDFVELMVQVFRGDAWAKWWHLLEDDWQSNPFGWGYDLVCKKACGLTRIGIIDSESVCHVRSWRHHENKKAVREMEKKYTQQMLALLERYQTPYSVCESRPAYEELV